MNVDRYDVRKVFLSGTNRIVCNYIAQIKKERKKQQQQNKMKLVEMLSSISRLGTRDRILNLIKSHT